MIYKDCAEVEKDILDWLLKNAYEFGEDYDECQLVATGNDSGSWSFNPKESAEKFSELIYDDDLMYLMREIHENPERLYLYDSEGFEVLARICLFPAAWEAYQESKEA